MAWDHVAKVRLLLLRPVYPRGGMGTQTAQTRKSPGSNPGGDTKTPDTELAYGLNLKFGGCGFESHSGDQHSLVAEWHMRCAKNAGLVRVRLPPGLPNIRIAQEDSAPVF